MAQRAVLSGSAICWVRDCAIPPEDLAFLVCCFEGDRHGDSETSVVAYYISDLCVGCAVMCSCGEAQAREKCGTRVGTDA